MGDELEQAIKDLMAGLGDVAKGMAGIDSDGLEKGLGTVTSAMGNLQQSTALTGIALNQMSEFMGRISGQIGGFVSKFNPTSMQMFALAADDSAAAVGSILVPVLDRFRYVVQGLGDLVASLTPNAKAMVAGLAVAGVGMATMTALTYALSAAISTATGGISAVLGAVVGGAAGMAFVMKDVAEVQALVTTVMKGFSAVANTLGTALMSVAKAFEPVIAIVVDSFGKIASMIAGGVVKLLPAIEVIAKAMAGLAEAWVGIVTANLTAVIPIIVTLADMLSTLIPPIIQIVEVFMKMGGTLFQILAVVANLVLLPFKPVIAALSTALELLMAPISVVTSLMSGLAELFQSVLSPIIRAFGDVLAAPFLLLRALWQTVMTPIMAAIKDIFKAFGELKSAFGELAAVFADLWDVVKEIAKELGGEIGGLIRSAMGPLVTLAHMFADTVRRVAAAIKELAADLRFILGLPEKDNSSHKKDASKGMALRNVGTSSASEMLKSAQMSAFSIGKDADPAKETAKHTGGALELLRKISKHAEDIEKKIGVTGKVAAEAGSTAADIGGGVMGRLLRNMVVGG